MRMLGFQRVRLCEYVWPWVRYISWMKLIGLIITRSTSHWWHWEGWKVMVGQWSVHITLMILRRFKGHGRPVISLHHIDDIEKIQTSWSASDQSTSHRWHWEDSNVMVGQWSVHITLMTLRRFKGHGRPVVSPHHIDDIEKVQRSWSASDQSTSHW